MRDLWDNIKQANICIIGIPEGKEKEKGVENTFEDIMPENFPILNTKLPFFSQQIQKIQELNLELVQ